MEQLNRYKFPQCPNCKRIGGIVESKIKKCTNQSCHVDLYWFGGYVLA